MELGQVWTQCHSLAFDYSVWEIWGALLHGGRVVVVPDSVVRSAEDLHALLVSEQVSVLSQTPSAFYALQTADALAPELGQQLKLQTVVFGGEAEFGLGRIAGADDWVAEMARPCGALYPRLDPLRPRGPPAARTGDRLRHGDC